MACVGRTKECTIVPSNHFGPIPGIPVGTMWRFRVQVCADVRVCGSASGRWPSSSPSATEARLGFTPDPSLVWLGLWPSGAEGSFSRTDAFGSKGQTVALKAGVRAFELICTVWSTGCHLPLGWFTGQRVGGPSTSRGGYPRPEQSRGLLLGPGWRV